MHTYLLMRARAPAAGALHRAGGIQGIRGWHFRPYFCKEQPLRFCEVYPPCRPATRVGQAGCALERAQASAGWLVPAALQPQRSASASHQMQTTVGTTTQACRQAMCGIPLEKWTLLLLQLLCPRSAAVGGPAGFTEAAAHHTTKGAGTACLPARHASRSFSGSGAPSVTSWMAPRPPGWVLPLPLHNQASGGGGGDGL